MTLNDRVANRMAAAFSSMTMFWTCAALDVLAIPGVVATVLTVLGHSLPHLFVYLTVMVTVVSFLSQTVIQLLALPVLARQNDEQAQMLLGILARMEAREVKEATELDELCAVELREGTD